MIHFSGLEELTKVLAKIKSQFTQPNNLNKWREWAIKILKQKHLPIFERMFCAYGHAQVVEKVKPFGGGYIFWSRVCGGCPIGSYTIKLLRAGRKIPTDVKFCSLLESGLLTRDPVKPGDIYTLPE